MHWVDEVLDVARNADDAEFQYLLERVIVARMEAVRQAEADAEGVNELDRKEWSSEGSYYYEKLEVLLSEIDDLRL